MYVQLLELLPMAKLVLKQSVKANGYLCLNSLIRVYMNIRLYIRPSVKLVFSE